MGSGGDAQIDEVEAANADQASRLFRAKGLFVTLGCSLEPSNAAAQATSIRALYRAE
jgi:hypothetical protein